MRDEPKTLVDRASEAARWWRDLQDLRADGSPNPRADRASRARLRRADCDAAMTEEAVLALYRRLAPASLGFDEQRLRDAVRLALVLAHVREDETEFEDGRRKGFARRLGRGSFGEPDGDAPLKPLRFQRLLAARDDEDIVREFRRAVDMLGNRANVRDLAGLLLHWRQDKTRTRFAFDYFAAGCSAASPVSAETDDAVPA